MSIIGCKSCRHQSLSCDSFLELSLPIPSSGFGSKVDLKSCFEAFTRESSLISYKCEGCNKIGDCTQNVSIYRYPKVLIIQLKRFCVVGYRREKLNVDVNFPEILSLAQFATNELILKANYKLYGISHHIGSLGYGHYIAECSEGNS